ncbi:MAG: hypothetical protein KF823_02955 [Xanthomonadales bacterium]|nr:hypothetical protein [Xanthomonadales bacterium]
MADSTPESDRSGRGDAEGAASAPRIAFERLRERTDELELIISGLIAFALLAVPSRLFEAWAQADVHAGSFGQFVLMFGYMIGAGLCYTLAGAFIVHLAVRGYWVGLIGLKACFPEGIRWERIGTLGPIARDYYRARLPDLMSAIDRADRAASVLFAMVTLIGLLILWSGVALIAVLGLAWLFGLASGAGESTALLVAFGLYVLVMSAVTVSALVDAVLVRRRPALAQLPWLRRLVERLLAFYGWLLPQRLILPVQLTLHSNTSGRAFVAALFVIMFVASLVGIGHVVGSRAFTVIGAYEAIDTDAVEHGMASAHYEDQRGPGDRLLRWPMIPSDQVGRAHLRLFIPHLPARDNPLLASRCPAPTGDDAGAGAARTARLACLAGLWTVTLDGAPVDLGTFLPAERRDLGLRGLQGYLSMAGLAPGRHDLRLVWNAGAGTTGASRERSFLIPFWLSPGYDIGRDEAP